MSATTESKHSWLRLLVTKMLINLVDTKNLIHHLLLTLAIKEKLMALLNKFSNLRVNLRVNRTNYPNQDMKLKNYKQESRNLKSTMKL